MCYRDALKSNISHCYNWFVDSLIIPHKNCWSLIYTTDWSPIIGFSCYLVVGYYRFDICVMAPLVVGDGLAITPDKRFTITYHIWHLPISYREGINLLIPILIITVFIIRALLTLTLLTCYILLLAVFRLKHFGLKHWFEDKIYMLVDF